MPNSSALDWGGPDITAYFNTNEAAGQARNGRRKGVFRHPLKMKFSFYFIVLLLSAKRVAMLGIAKVIAMHCANESAARPEFKL
jgi:hypothetical protein